MQLDVESHVQPSPAPVAPEQKAEFWLPGLVQLLVLVVLTAQPPAHVHPSWIPVVPPVHVAWLVALVQKVVAVALLVQPPFQMHP